MPDEDPNDYKIIVALAGIFVYIIFAYLTDYGFSGFVVYFSALIGLLGMNYKTEELKVQYIIIGGIWFKVQYIIIGGIWFTILLAWFFLFRDSSATAYFLLFATALSIGMDPKNVVLFLGTTLLAIGVFGASIIGFVVMVTLMLFIHSALDEENGVALGLVMMVPLLIVGWFIGSGWATTVEQKVTSVATEIEATTGISTETITNKITYALNDTWMLFTNPNKWYEKQFATEGTRDEGATPSALEIIKIEALPNTVMPKETFDVMFEVENKGTSDSESVTISAHAGDSLAAACGKVEGKYCLRSCSGGGLAPTCKILKPLGKIAVKEKRFDSFTFQAPECPGTYTAGGRVMYSYEADATLSLQMISREYYEELLRNNKMKWIDELSVASAGPFKLTLRTDRQQPIPDRTVKDEPQRFKIYFGLVNEHEGIATLKSATLDMPESFELVNYLSEEKSNPNPKLTAPAYTIDNGCTLTYDATMTEQECRDTTNSAKCSDKTDTAAVISFPDINIATNHESYIKIANAFKEKATKSSGVVSLKPITLDAEMKQNDWKYYKCGFQLEKGKEKISQIETLFLRTHVDYDFEYTRDTTITVREVGGIPPNCKETISKVSAIDSAQTKPQAKADIVEALADKIDACYRSSSLWWTDNHLCGTYKIDIEGCTGDTIKGSDILEILNEFKSEAHKNPVVVNSIDADNKMTTTCEIGTAEAMTCPEELFNDRYIYTKLEIWYMIMGTNNLQMNIFAAPEYMQADSADCKGERDVCDIDKGDCQELYECKVAHVGEQPTCVLITV